MINKKIKSKIFNCYFLILIFLCIGNAFSQDFSMKDYKRSESFSWEKINNKRVFNLRLTKSFFPNDSGMWFLTYDKNGKFFKRVDFKDYSVSELFNQQRLAEKISVITKKSVHPDSLPFNNLDYHKEDSIRIKIDRETYVLNLNDYSLIKDTGKSKEENTTETASPDGKWVAFTKDYNLYIRSTENDEIIQLSTDGKEKYEYASYYGWADIIYGENGKRPEKFYVNWSSDSKYLQASICDLRSAQKMYLLDHSIDTLYRAKLLSYYRGSPGDTAMVYLKPVFYDIRKKEKIAVDLPKRTHINQYNFRWLEKKNSMLVVDNKRGYKEKVFKLISLETGKTKDLFNETSDTNLAENFQLIVFDSLNKFVFSSERSGWNHLYLYDMKTGKTKALTKGNFRVHRTVNTDYKKGIIHFLASGMNENDNPYSQYLCSVDIANPKLNIITNETGHHNITFSNTEKYIFDDYSTISKVTEFYLRDANTGKIHLKIDETNLNGLDKTGWVFPEVFTAIARDKKTTIYGALWKPSNFDPKKKYPVIDQTYTGPHTQVFPKYFEQAFWSSQELAELGFIVVKVDGMGTYGRSKAFHDVSYKNMGQNLKDHVLAIEQLAEKYKWIDLDRVGIYGHSAGAYDAAHALLEFPDFYKVGVASAGDHDFRMEKAWWPEMYMGWPVDSLYHKVSNITMAAKLKGKLLLAHGGIDDNVNPSATFKLAEAFINADKEFDLLILPSQRHGFRGKHQKYFEKKRMNYFIKHLLGKEPIWNLD
jgi:dipeptidyl-peptidase 4